MWIPTFLIACWLLKWLHHLLENNCMYFLIIFICDFFIQFTLFTSWFPICESSRIALEERFFFDKFGRDVLNLTSIRILTNMMSSSTTLISNVLPSFVVLHNTEYFLISIGLWLLFQQSSLAVGTFYLRCQTHFIWFHLLLQLLSFLLMML